MTKPKFILNKILIFALVFLETHFSECHRVHVLGSNSLQNNGIDAMVKRGCDGGIGECLWTTEEAEMDSEINRRVLLMQKKYISYETLRKDMVPCSKPGVSYYNCRVMGQANPYNRGCEVITRCRGRG